MPETIELRQFREHPAAAVMLHLARGQLNLAFSKHGLASPNPLRAERTEIDDPFAEGKGSGPTWWEAEMPAELVNPVLDILRRTYVVLCSRPGSAAARDAALEAATVLQRIASSGD